MLCAESLRVQGISFVKFVSLRYTTGDFIKLDALRAVIYLRVSTKKQAEEGTSLETQETACLRKAQEMGAQVVTILKDEGVSGALYMSRPGMQ